MALFHGVDGGGDVEAVAVEGVGGDDAFGGLTVAEDGVDDGPELADQRRLARRMGGRQLIFRGSGVQ